MKKTLFLSAILGAALCSSAMGAALTTDTSVIGEVTYNGGVFTVTGTTFSSAAKSADVTSENGTVTQGSSIGWHAFASNQDLDYGHTVHLTQAGTYRTDFAPFTIGGLIVDAVSGNVQLGRTDGGTFEINGAHDANMDINADTTLVGNSSVKVYKGGTWDVASGKTLTLSSDGGVTIASNQTVSLIGAGTLAINTQNLTFDSGASLTVGTGTTLALQSGNGWTVVDEARTEGNGYGLSASYSRDFGTALVNNGTITVNGNNATLTNGVVSATGDSKIYYINDASQAIDFSQAKDLVVGTTTVSLTSGVENLNNLTVSGGTVTLNNEASFKGNLLVKNGGTVTVGKNDKLDWGTAGIGKSLTVEANSTLDLSTHRFSMGYYTVNMKGGTIAGTGDAEGALDFHQTRGNENAIVATGAVASTISAVVKLRTGINVMVDDGAQLTMSGLIKAGNGITKKGAGTLTLSHADNTFTGGVTVAAGKLLASAENSLGTGNAIVNGGELSLSARQNAASFTVNNGGTLSLTNGGKNGNVANGITVNGGGTLASQATDSLGYTGVQNDGHPTASLTLSGTSATQLATWTMTHRQTVMGTALTFNGNTIIKAAASGLGTGNNAPKLDFNSGSISVTGTNNKINVPLLLSKETMTINTGDSAGNVLTLAGAITGNNRSINVVGDGHLEIAADLANVTISGNTALAGGSRINMTGTVTLGNMVNDLTGNTSNNYALVGGSALNIAGEVDLTKKSNGTANANSNIGMTKGNTITVQTGASLTAGRVMNTETGDNNATVVVQNGAVLTADRLLSPSFTNNGTATITGSTDLKQGFAGTGIVNLTNSGALTFGKRNTTVTSLTLNGGSITLGTAEDHDATLTTTDLTVNADAEINADLVVNSGTLTFADNAILTMGCDVTIGDTVTVVLTDAMVESIMNGNDVEIIAGVDKAYLSQSLTFIGSGDMSGYVTEHESVYSLKQVGDKIYIVPEPATATLSLLALAALCARRKRH